MPQVLKITTGYEPRLDVTYVHRHLTYEVWWANGVILRTCNISQAHRRAKEVNGYVTVVTQDRKA